MGATTTTTFKLHSIIDAVQQKHGLRQDEYHRYRKYCGRKVRRIRHKYISVKSKDHKRKDPSNIIMSTKDKVIMTLFKVERNWSYAMALRKEAMTEPRKTFHARRKWKMATKDAINLFQLIQKNYDEESLVEARVYYLWIAANRAFEYRRWSHVKRFLELFDELIKQINAPTILLTRRQEESTSLQRYCDHMISKHGVDPIAFDLNLIDPIIADEDDHTIVVEIKGLDWKFRMCELSDAENVAKRIDQFRLGPKRKFVKLDGDDDGLIFYGGYGNAVDAYIYSTIYMSTVNEALYQFPTIQDKNLIIDDGLLNKDSKGTRGLIRSLYVNSKLCLENLESVLHSQKDEKFQTEARKLRDIIGSLCKFFEAVNGILRGRTMKIPKVPKINELDFKFFPKFGGPKVDEIIFRLSKETSNILEAQKICKEDGLILTPLGPISSHHPGSVLADMNKFHYFNRGEALLREKSAGPLIPSKPIFYDLAYDKLMQPSLNK